MNREREDIMDIVILPILVAWFLLRIAGLSPILTVFMVLLGLVVGIISVVLEHLWIGREEWKQ